MGDIEMNSLDRMNDATNQDAFWDDMTQGDLQADDRVKTVSTKKLTKEDKQFQAAVRAARGSKELQKNVKQEVVEKGTVDTIQDGINDAVKRIRDGLREGAKETKTILILVAVAAFFVSRATK